MTDRDRAASEARFDAELRTAARSLVQEPLSPAILDPALAPDLRDLRAPRPLTTLAATAVVVGLLVLGAAMTVLPGGLPPPATASPPAETVPPPLAFKSLNDVIAHLVVFGYRCNDALPPDKNPLDSGPDLIESTVCATPDASGMMTAVIVSKLVDGPVGSITIKADIAGQESLDARSSVGSVMGQIVHRVLTDMPGAIEAEAWLHDNVVRLERGGPHARLDLRGFRFEAARHENGDYILTFGPPTPTR